MIKKYSISMAAAALGVMISSSVLASSHRDAPYITKYPQVDGTDFYAFRSYETGRDGYVTFIANYIPVQASYGGPNYFTMDENALYEIHIDNNGDAIEDITFQFDFDNAEPASGTAMFAIGVGENLMQIPATLRNVGGVSAEAMAPATLNYQESYSVTMVTGDRRTGAKTVVTNGTGSNSFKKPFDYSGTKTFSGEGGYAAYANMFKETITIEGCALPGRVFVGQRAEGFKIALGETFDLINYVPIDGDSAPGAADGNGFPGGVTQNPMRNVLGKNNITSIALEVPIVCVTGDAANNGVIGAWTTASLRQATLLNKTATLNKPEVALGPWVQVSRLGSILVNELFIGFPDKDKFNGSEPKDDAYFGKYVTHPVLPAIVDLLFKDAVNTTLGANIENLAPSNIPRMDLVAGFLTGFPGVNQLSTVTASEMLRLNTGVAVTARAMQNTLGVAAGDLAGFPNGRRPGDDAVDIGLRVAMGVLCHPLPIGPGGVATNLGICEPEDAPVGDAALTDGAPISAMDFDASFPYLLTPYPGSPFNAPMPMPAAQ